MTKTVTSSGKRCLQGASESLRGQRDILRTSLGCPPHLRAKELLQQPVNEIPPTSSGAVSEMTPSSLLRFRVTPVAEYPCINQEDITRTVIKTCQNKPNLPTLYPSAISKYEC